MFNVKIEKLCHQHQFTRGPRSPHSCHQTTRMIFSVLKSFNLVRINHWFIFNYNDYDGCHKSDCGNLVQNRMGGYSVFQLMFQNCMPGFGKHTHVSRKRTCRWSKLDVNGMVLIMVRAFSPHPEVQNDVGDKSKFMSLGLVTNIYRLQNPSPTFMFFGWIICTVLCIRKRGLRLIKAIEK